MSIEHLVAAIQKLRRENDEFVPPPATEDAIVALAVKFQSEFGRALPEAYQRVLRLSDGVMFDGLIVWPSRRHWLFRESLIEANRDAACTPVNRGVNEEPWPERSPQAVTSSVHEVIVPKSLGSVASYQAEGDPAIVGVAVVAVASPHLSARYCSVCARSVGESARG